MKKLMLLLFVSVIIISCKKKECRKDDTSEGIITESIDFGCANVHKDKTYVIENEMDSYQIHGDAACPYVFRGDLYDFTKYTLLGQYASGKCRAKFHKNVERIDEEKRYHYSIKVYECDGCKKETESVNLVFVPKLPSDWIVTFSIEKIQE